ncbi:MAG: hypothetical protein IH598_16015 [Bacteroidales bacterium]|nr:hypothetical protein [Bacteroidales bacterium]
MKKSFLLLVMACFWLAGAFAQTGAIENLQVAQRTDGSGLVDIHFDLNGTGASYNLQFEASFDDGVNYEPLSETFLTGVLTDVLPGTGKHIIWAGKASHPETFSTQTRVRVIATEKILLKCGDPFIDQRDGNSYATVQIGNQCWMSENLAWLPAVSPSSQGSETIPHYYVYDYEGTDVSAAKVSANYYNFGVLYNWPASHTACPDGWYLPTEVEWTALAIYLSSQPEYLCNSEPSYIAKALAASSDWYGSSGTCAVGNNLNDNDATSFSGLPGGLRSIYGEFYNIGYNGLWWSSEDNATGSWERGLGYNDAYLHIGGGNKGYGYSVRCIKSVGSILNQPPLPPSNPSPETGSINQPINITLTWSCSDPEGDPLTYDVYFGTDDNPPLAVAGISTQTYTTVTLQYSTPYYWKIVAHDDQGNTTEGDVWSFTTLPQPEWQCGDVLIDTRDGNEYSSVQIGDQCWMAENLAYLPSVSQSSQYSNNDPYYYVYGYQGTNTNTAKATENYQNYGVLFNWPASLTACPEGWHLPTYAQWTQLVDYLGSQGINLHGNALKSCRQVNSPLSGDCNTMEHPRWNSDATNHGFDEFGFSALPGGIRHMGIYGNLGMYGHWWSATEYNSTIAWNSVIISFWGAMNKYSDYEKSTGMSVRCLKNMITGAVLPIVTTTVINGITSTTANAGGNVTEDGGAPVTARGVVWSTTPNPTLEVNEGFTTDGEGSGEFTSVIIGTPNITYHVKAYATNCIGTAYGENVIFKTSSVNPCQSQPVLVDERDGNAYNTVQIGDQCWMAENLAYLPEVSPPSEGSATNPYYYVVGYQGSDVNTAKTNSYYQNYGVLYNWPASITACPLGWHLPADTEWIILIDYIVGEGYPNQPNDPNGAGNALKSCRQGYSPLGGVCNTSKHPLWSSNSTTHGFDEFGFSGLPAGNRLNYGAFGGLGTTGIWWSYTESSATNTWGYILNYGSTKVSSDDLYKEMGSSIRCLKD